MRGMVFVRVLAWTELIEFYSNVEAEDPDREPLDAEWLNRPWALYYDARGTLVRPPKGFLMVDDIENDSDWWSCGFDVWPDDAARLAFSDFSDERQRHDELVEDRRR
jgi:hypothetical protein